MAIARLIEELVAFGIKKELIGKWDVMQARNNLLDLFQVAEPYYGDKITEVPESPLGILEAMLDYAYEKGMFEENTVTYRDLFDTKIMGCILGRESEIIERYNRIAKESGLQAATKDFYEFGINSNYIRMDRIAKNVVWEAPTEYGDLEITINLSKPEKDPKAIAAAKKMKQSGFPKCLLCTENVGFAGHLNHPARQNLRIIPLMLNNEQWMFQYSPYVYYNEHCIILKESHDPMKLVKDTFRRLVDFVEAVPHYFIGSNADLPIVGGSILSHDHFQGGNHEFPMAKAEIESKYTDVEFPNVEFGLVKWPMSVIRVKSKDKKAVVEAVDKLYEEWKVYSDIDNEIHAFTIEGEEKVPHNTVTPIARMRGGYFEVDIVLRNNRTSDEYPDGIFHPHVELHHIKKENIGLIEVMGLAVLPGRLVTELAEVENVLSGKANYNKEALKSDEVLGKHADWIEAMTAKYGSSLTEDKAKEIVKKEVGYKFSDVLSHAGVFKRDEKGIAGFVKFLNSIGIK